MEPGTQRGAVVESWVAEVLKFDQSMVTRLSLWSEWQLLTSIGRFNDAGIFMSACRPNLFRGLRRGQLSARELLHIRITVNCCFESLRSRWLLGRSSNTIYSLFICSLP